MSQLDYMFDLYRDELFKNIGYVTNKESKSYVKDHIKEKISILQERMETLDKWYPDNPN